ncbi:AAA family ATPase [Leptolyngbya sp. AN02str]|uniref:AAA family ATPase n=1 Tax=Leptolyngbya sp. AN02str TaxID=3423363 RepID=UPI003D31D214
MELHTDQLPSDLFEQSNQQRLDFFKNDQYAISHRNLDQAVNVLLQRACSRSQSELILVVGPSGVGKSILLRLLENLVIREVLPELIHNPGLIPFINIEAMATGQGKFMWDGLYRQILVALGELYIDQKIDYGTIQDSLKRKKPSSGKRASEITLLNALLTSLSHRKPYVVAIDEMQHIIRTASSSTLEDYGERIKFLMEGSQVVWVGFGTYQLLRLLNSDLRSSGITKIIHFPRYHYEVEQDAQEFQRILSIFQSRVPLPETPSLCECWEFCYERSIGCVGILKGWLTQAVALALEETANTLSISHLERTAKLTFECQQMVKDGIEGEARVAEYLAEQSGLFPDYLQGNEE